MSTRRTIKKVKRSEIVVSSSSVSKSSPTMLPDLLSTIDEHPGYHAIVESSSSIILSGKLSKPPTQLDLLGNATIDGDNFRLFIRGYSDLYSGINPSAALLLDALIVVATDSRLQETLVELPMSQFMYMRGLTNAKETRRQVKRDLDALSRIRFEYRGTGKSKSNWLNVSLSGGTSGIHNSIIYFRFNEDFFRSFFFRENILLFMFYPLEALRANPHRNPHARPLAYRIAAHKRMNMGKPNEHIISVRTLLEACPNLALYEEVVKSDGAVTRRIIEPFERDLTALSPALTWSYQKHTTTPASYDDFCSENIVVSFSNYPSADSIIAGKKRHSTRKKPMK